MKDSHKILKITNGCNPLENRESSTKIIPDAFFSLSLKEKKDHNRCSLFLSAIFLFHGSLNSTFEISFAVPSKLSKALDHFSEGLKNKSKPYFHYLFHRGGSSKYFDDGLKGLQNLVKFLGLFASMSQVADPEISQGGQTIFSP